MYRCYNSFPVIRISSPKFTRINLRCLSPTVYFISQTTYSILRFFKESWPKESFSFSTIWFSYLRSELVSHDNSSPLIVKFSLSSTHENDYQWTCIIVRHATHHRYDSCSSIVQAYKLSYRLAPLFHMGRYTWE